RAAPTPVSLCATRYIHASFCAEVEKILQWGNGQRSHRRPCQMYQRGSGFSTIARRTLEIAPHAVPLIIGQFFIPFSSWWVVVRAGIHDGVGDKIVRQIWIV